LNRVVEVIDLGNGRFHEHVVNFEQTLVENIAAERHGSKAVIAGLDWVVGVL
jgi:hypothetical protein